MASIETRLVGIEKLFSDKELAERRAAILSALGHPVRLRLVAALCLGEERTVTDLCTLLELSQPTASRQLSWLRLHGLVRARQAGGFRWYSLALPRLVDLMSCLVACGRGGGDR